jgi:hypothetical protein
MERYNEYRSCLKCGYVGIDTEYGMKVKTLNNRKLDYKSIPNVLTRTCKRCGYVWYEKPLDSGT